MRRVFARGRVAVLAEVLFQEKEDGSTGQRHEHDDLENIFGNEQRDARADGRADQRADARDDRRAHLDLAAAEVFDRSRRRADAVDNFVCAHCKVSRDTGHEIGRQRDESAAAGDRVDKAAEKDERQNNKQDLRCEFHGDSPRFLRFLHFITGEKVLLLFCAKYDKIILLIFYAQSAERNNAMERNNKAAHEGQLGIICK